jgi:hypothetical protein
VESVGERLERLLDLSRIDGQRRRQPDDVIAGRKHKQAAHATGRDDIRRGAVDDGAQ